MGFTEWIKTVVNKANTTLNGEQAKKIKKQLLTWGGIGVGLGIVMIVAGMILSMSNAFSADMTFNTGPMFAGIIVFFIGGVILTFSSIALQAGIKIVIAAIGTDMADVDKHKVCPNCGDRVEDNEIFCNKCGTDLRAKKLCKKCNFQNDLNDKFCRNCGEQLDE